MLFERYDSVIIIPPEAKGDHTHPKCEEGVVTGMDINYVYVRRRIGGVLLTQEVACLRENLLKKEKVFETT